MSDGISWGVHAIQAFESICAKEKPIRMPINIAPPNKIANPIPCPLSSLFDDEWLSGKSIFEPDYS
jgi:hypothetical protein